jgi:serralysin
MANGIQIGPSGSPDIDGVLWGWCWQANQPNFHTLLTFSFPTSTAAYLGYTAVNGFEAFNDKQLAAASKILAMYDNVCNVDFILSADPAAGNIRLAEMTSIDVGTGPHAFPTAYGIAPDPNNAPAFAHGDAWFNHKYYNNPVLGSFAFAAGLMHEIGHTLGLKHGHMAQDVQNASGAYVYTNPSLPANHDSFEYSVMTYRGYPGASIKHGITAKEFPSTPMQDDIAALQYLYGANFDYNSGNTVYTFSSKTGAMSIDGVSQGATFHHKIFLTVWDGSGNDTYDLSNYKTNEVIDLNPGAWSTPSKAQRADLDLFHPGHHMARGCIANALLLYGDPHGYIENAIGGSGNDKIYGNAVSNALLGGGGNDKIHGGDSADALVGGRGRDIIYGDAGADDFIFTAASQSGSGAKHHDSVMDFNGLEGDLIDLSGFDANSRAAGLQHFDFIDIQAFDHTAGELRFANHLLQGDVNGDGKADFEVYLSTVLLFSFDLKLE